MVSLSHISLRTSIREQFDAALSFYTSKLGFQAVSTHNDKTVVFLHHFSAGSNTINGEGQGQGEHSGATVKLMLEAAADTTTSNAAHAVVDLEHKRKLAMLLSNIEMGNSSAPVLNAAFSFWVSNVHDMAETLKQGGAPCRIVPAAGLVGVNSSPSVFTLDPLSNLIEFTSSPVFGLGSKGTNNAATNTPSSSDAKRIKLDNAGVLPVKQAPARGKRIGILTSGGDSSGMNAAVRSITRYAIYKGCDPYAVYDGYDGLVDGGNKIVRLGWEDVRGFLSVGGTNIGSARCARFRTREGRMDAAYNMIKNGIDALIVIGGDGSLTGADMLRAEWKGLLDDLIKAGRLTADECLGLRENLTIVGLVGSIDNDMSLTDITIGAVTSLHRICESLDSLTSTALSHQRAFVVEVMGRHCGWLALMAAIAVGADWVFLPERPPPTNEAQEDDWEAEMCERLKQQRQLGSRKTMVIVCEGAIDRHLNPIKPEYIKQVIDKRLGLDTRVTTLGHVQRGGTPCAYDRYLGTMQGVEAVEAVLRSTPDTPSPMIGMSQNKIISVPLMEAVKLTHAVGDAISKKDFKHAMELRDPDFAASYNAYVESTLMSAMPGSMSKLNEQPLRIGILHIGAPAGGMNAATRIAARLCLNRGHVPLAIRNGFSGLLKDEVNALTWTEMTAWQVKGGSDLGTNRDHPEPLNNGGKSNLQLKGITSLINLGQIAYHLQKHNIQALLLIGGFEAYTATLTLARARSEYPAFCIPMVTLPATVSNNVPGTEYSVGSDTALNVIVESCDRIKLSANASRNRVFVVEVQGGNCGYLAVLGGLSCGATTSYIPETGISIDVIQKDIQHLVRRYKEDNSKGIPNEGRIILRTESASADVYTTDVISNILKAEGKGLFDSRTAVFGHLQQGGVPSPLDRIRATRLAVECIDWIEQAAACKEVDTVGCILPSVYTTRSDHACVIGIRGAQVVFSPVEELLKETDVKKRRGVNAWWMDVNKATKILAKYDTYAD